MLENTEQNYKITITIYLLLTVYELCFIEKIKEQRKPSSLLLNSLQ